MVDDAESEHAPRGRAESESGPSVTRERTGVTRTGASKDRLATDGGEESVCVRCGATMTQDVRYCMDCRRERGDDPAEYPVVDPTGVNSSAEDDQTNDTGQDGQLRRRAVLAGASVGLLGFGALIREDVMARMNAVIHSVGRYWLDVQLEAVGLDDLTWDEETLVLEFVDDPEADGWSIAHQEADAVEDPIVMGTTRPASVELPFERLIDEHDGPIPDRSFEFAALAGSFGDWSVDTADHRVDDVIDTLVFDAPDPAVQ